jgi:hypothetical protein
MRPCASSSITLNRLHELDHSVNMPSESTYPNLPIPDVDLWGFLFERKEKPYSDDKGKLLFRTNRLFRILFQRS